MPPRLPQDTELVQATWRESPSPLVTQSLWVKSYFKGNTRGISRHNMVTINEKRRWSEKAVVGSTDFTWENKDENQWKSPQRLSLLLIFLHAPRQEMCYSMERPNLCFAFKQKQRNPKRMFRQISLHGPDSSTMSASIRPAASSLCKIPNSFQLQGWSCVASPDL